MKSGREALIWQWVGAAVGISGGSILLWAFIHYGVDSIEQVALNWGILAAFLMLIGIAFFCSGRALAVEYTRMTRREEFLWIVLTSACFVGGAMVVLAALVKSDAFINYVSWLAMVLTGAFSIVAGVFFLIARRLASAQQEVFLQKIEIRKQQELAESLLLNTLPASIAAELKEKGAVDPKYYEDVTILFTDFKGFTLSTEKLAAEELVKALNEYFTAFDNVVQRYGLEKLKTIGDMAVAGLPERRASHAVDAVLAAFDIVDEVLKAHAKGLPAWSIRVGVHTSPVVSGVVGILKFAFDIWGESVDFASRMESNGAPNRVNLSASTYTRVKDFFECEYRGKVPTKEGREFEMYFAVGPLAGLRQSGDVSEAFKTRYKTYFQRELTTLPASITGKVAAGTGA